MDKAALRLPRLKTQDELLRSAPEIERLLTGTEADGGSVLAGRFTSPLRIRPRSPNRRTASPSRMPRKFSDDEPTEEERVRAELDKVKSERAALLQSLAALRADTGKSGGDLQQEDIRLLRRELDAKREKLNELRRATRGLHTMLEQLETTKRDCEQLMPGGLEGLQARAGALASELAEVEQCIVEADAKHELYKLLELRTRRDHAAAQKRMRKARALQEGAAEDFTALTKKVHESRARKEDAERDLGSVVMMFDQVRADWGKKLKDRRKEVRELERQRAEDERRKAALAALAAEKARLEQEKVDKTRTDREAATRRLSAVVPELEVLEATWARLQGVCGADTADDLITYWQELRAKQASMRELLRLAEVREAHAKQDLADLIVERTQVFDTETARGERQKKQVAQQAAPGDLAPLEHTDQQQVDADEKQVESTAAQQAASCVVPPDTAPEDGQQAASSSSTASQEAAATDNTNTDVPLGSAAAGAACPDSEGSNLVRQSVDVPAGQAPAPAHADKEQPAGDAAQAAVPAGSTPPADPEYVQDSVAGQHTCLPNPASTEQTAGEPPHQAPAALAPAAAEVSLPTDGPAQPELPVDVPMPHPRGEASAWAELEQPAEGHPPAGSDPAEKGGSAGAASPASSKAQLLADPAEMLRRQQGLLAEARQRRHEAKERFSRLSRVCMAADQGLSMLALRLRTTMESAEGGSGGGAARRATAQHGGRRTTLSVSRRGSVGSRRATRRTTHQPGWRASVASLADRRASIQLSAATHVLTDVVAPKAPPGSRAKGKRRELFAELPALTTDVSSQLDRLLRQITEMQEAKAAAEAAAAAAAAAAAEQLRTLTGRSEAESDISGWGDEATPAAAPGDAPYAAAGDPAALPQAAAATAEQPAPAALPPGESVPQAPAKKLHWADSRATPRLAGASAGSSFASVAKGSGQGSRSGTADAEAAAAAARGEQGLRQGFRRRSWAGPAWLTSVSGGKPLTTTLRKMTAARKQGSTPAPGASRTAARAAAGLALKRIVGYVEEPDSDDGSGNPFVLSSSDDDAEDDGLVDRQYLKHRSHKLTNPKVRAKGGAGVASTAVKIDAR